MSTPRQWRRPMRARDRHEPHRVATPLELLFDLCFVVAIAQLGQLLHHSITEHHVAHGVVGFVIAFFAVWWAWMNFTWFASAYDTDDVPYRLTALVQISGVLVLAAGIPDAFEGHLGVVTLGYAIMRIGLVVQWLRASFSVPASDGPGPRRTARRMAVGVTACLIGWTLLLSVHGTTFLLLWPVMVAAELAVPVWAERDHPTPWHPHHIAERYGLLFIIVLGEVVLSTTLAVEGGFRAGRLWWIAGSGLVIVFSFWWLYFERPVHDRLRGNREAFVWGYGHCFVFGSAAALGAGLAVVLEDDASGPPLAVCLPVALLLVSLQLLHLDGPRRQRRRLASASASASASALAFASYLSAFIVIVLAFSGYFALPLVALVLAALVAVRVAATPSAASATTPAP
ncbi:low temperature requirement protein A [Dactylosporangium sp. NPDC051541]|uniref:low temperature requirement protein A n=1 Tax=Dactylosporangium sp. NPDC051541 TaxID=3363977 RepID=UPI00379045E7